jgi:hypothetical protein
VGVCRKFESFVGNLGEFPPLLIDFEMVQILMRLLIIKSFRNARGNIQSRALIYKRPDPVNSPFSFN